MMNAVQIQYSQALGGLVRLTETVADNLAAVREAAAKRGHLTSLGRAESLAQQLAVELSELQVTNATQNVRG
jgi:rRNA maturation endonuclease Nob1